MAVPSSGELSLQGIANEMLQDDYNAALGYTNISLGDMGSGTAPYSINTGSASYPNSAAPHGMAEFYGYDNDASSVKSFLSSIKASSFDVCSKAQNVTMYHNGSGTYPVVGDIVSFDLAQTNLPNGGHFRSGSGWVQIYFDFSFPVANPTGAVIATGIC